MDDEEDDVEDSSDLAWLCCWISLILAGGYFLIIAQHVVTVPNGKIST